jgi:hypothetical protein
MTSMRGQEGNNGVAYFWIVISRDKVSMIKIAG